MTACSVMGSMLQLPEESLDISKEWKDKLKEAGKPLIPLLQLWCLLPPALPLCKAVAFIFPGTYLLHIFWSAFLSFPFPFLKFIFRFKEELVPKTSCSNCHRCLFSLCWDSAASGWMTNSRSTTDLSSARLSYLQ